MLNSANLKSYQQIGKRKNFSRFLSNLFFYQIVFALIIFQTVLTISAQTSSQSVEIAAVGDILLTRGVERQIEKFGADYPFEKVKNVLVNGDLSFGNLENPVAENCKKKKKKFSFQAKPEYLKILDNVNFDVLSLANNHSFDCGQIGLVETIEHLENENLRWAGAGRNAAEAEKPVYIEIRKIKFAFLGFTAIFPVNSLKKSANVNFATAEKVSVAVAEARKKADVVIVSFHWGTEYDSRPNAMQISLANTAIDAGADVILGHHPHVLQGLKLIDKQIGEKRALVAFSLGNFLFDSPAKLIRKTAESMILKIRFNKKGFVSAEVVPVNIENTRPVIADKEKKEIIFNRLNKLSAEWNTFLDAGEIKPIKSAYANKSD